LLGSINKQHHDDDDDDDDDNDNDDDDGLGSFPANFTDVPL